MLFHKSVKNNNEHVSISVFNMGLNICLYIGLEIPLCGLSYFCAMFLGVSGVTSTMGNTREEYVCFGEVRVFTSPQKATNLGATQIHFHPSPTVFTLAHQATLNRYSRIYDAGG